jgi:alpha-1,6-mannosyltransferase
MMARPPTDRGSSAPDATIETRPSGAPPKTGGAVADARTSRRARAALGLLVLGYLAVDILAGAPRSPLVPAMPAGVGVPRWAARTAAWVGLDRLGFAASVVVCLAILGGIVAAFGVVGWEAWKRRVNPRLALGAVIVSVGLSLAGPLLLSRDVNSYAAYGRTLSVHNANPYEMPPSAFPDDPFTPVVSREWLHTRSVYGPAFTLASGAITRAWPRSPSATIQAFKVLAAVGVLAAAGFAGRIARRVRPERETLAVVLVGLNPVVVVHTVGGGHNDALVASLLAGACLLAVAALGLGGINAADGSQAIGRRALGGLALGATGLIAVAASVKVVAFLPLLFWWWALGRASGPPARVRVVGVHVVVAVAVTAALTAPVFAGLRTVTAIANLASRQGWASGARLVARAGEGIGRAMGGGRVGTAFGVAVYAAFVAVFAVLTWRLLWTGRWRASAGLWGMSLLLFALAAPYLLPWYAVWFLPFIALMGDDRLPVAGLVVAAALALTGVPAEPAPDPGLWRAMMLGVHYAVAPITLVLFIYAARLVVRATQVQRDAQAPGSVGRASLRLPA